MSFAELREAFFEALDQVDGNVTAAARQVGANQHTAAGWARKAGMRGRGLPGNGPHPRKGEYFQLRAAGVRRRDAVAWVGVNERTARDWDQGIRHTGNSRVYPDGTRIDYNTGMTTVVAAPGPDPGSWTR